MTRQKVLDLYFMEARAKLTDLAAFLDRVDRAEGQDDFRIKAFRRALTELQKTDPQRAKRVLLASERPDNGANPARHDQGRHRRMAGRAPNSSVSMNLYTNPSPGLRPPSPRFAGRGQGEGFVVKPLP